MPKFLKIKTDWVVPDLSDINGYPTDGYYLVNLDILERIDISETEIRFVHNWKPFTLLRSKHPGLAEFFLNNDSQKHLLDVVDMPAPESADEAKEAAEIQQLAFRAFQEVVGYGAKVDVEHLAQCELFTQAFRFGYKAAKK